MKTRNKLEHLILIAGVLFITFFIWILLKEGDKLDNDDSYAFLKKASYEEILDIDEEYYLYVYLEKCPDCKEAEPYILEFASKANLYVLDIMNANNRTRYDWQRHHEVNDIEIGNIKNDGTIDYYSGESGKKYTSSTKLDPYGHKMKYSIKIADENYLEDNKAAEIGKVYAVLKTPIINYSDIEDRKHIIIPAMPTMFHINSGEILEYYFDAPEIIEFIDTQL